MIARRGNNIDLEFNGVKRTVLFFEFSFKEVGDSVLLYQNDKILFRVPKSQIDIEELTNINLIIGKDGEQGEAGKDGRDGDKGLDGKDGKDGVDGTNGRDGRDGKDGINGEDGKDGKDGEPFVPSEEFIQGLKSKDGTDGKDGKNGLNGIDGEDGKDGENGANGKDGSNGSDGISFVWSGSYELGEDYEKNEVVEFEGSSFIAIQDTDEMPIKDGEINTEFWDLLALRGKNGRNGRDGANGGGVGVDEKVKANAGDAATGYLRDKLIDGTDVIYFLDAPPSGTTMEAQLTNTTVTAGSYTNTDLTVDANGRITAASNGTGGNLVKVSNNDSTANYLEDKIIAGDNITIDVLNEGANEQLEVNTSFDGISFDEYGNLIVENGLIYGKTTTPPAITGNTNDYAPTGIESTILLRISSTGNFSLTGLIAPPNVVAQQIIIFNVGLNNITLKNNDAASVAANRFLIGANKTIQTDEGISIIYDPVSLRYRGNGIII